MRRATPRIARLAIATIFFINGAVGANWFVRIPAVQQKLGASAGTLGLALLGMPMGGLLAMLTSGWLITRFGSRRITRVMAIAYCLVLPLPALAGSIPLLMLALVLLGGTSGAMSVAMNTQGVALEAQYNRPIMSSFHALYSIGSIAGAATGGVMASLGVDPALHLAGAAVILAIITLVVSPQLLFTDDRASNRGPTFALLTRRLISLGILAFCVLLVEGAMSDWSAIYLRRSLGTTAGFAAAGFGAFSLAMASGRLVGGNLISCFGPTVMVRFGSALAALGLCLALTINQPFAAIIGFASVGAGFASTFPIILSAAGRTSNMSSGVAIAAVSSTGYLGLMSGPPLIGSVAQVVTLRVALGIIIILSVIIALLAKAVDQRTALGLRHGSA